MDDGLISLGAKLRQLAESMPDAPAVTCGDRTVSFAELHRHSNQLARGLQSRGVEQGDLRAPYPDARYLCGNRQFTQMLVTTPDNPQLADNWEAWKTIRQFAGPFVTIMSEGDQVTRGSERRFIQEVPGCRGQPHVILEGGNHFLQEDIPQKLTTGLLAWLSETRSISTNSTHNLDSSK